MSLFCLKRRMKIKNSKEQLKQKLDEKISKEYEDYKGEILKKGPDEVFREAYKISALYDIAEYIYQTSFSVPEMHLFLKEKCLLESLYQEWLEIDDSRMEEIGNMVNEYKDYLKKTEKLIWRNER